VCDVRWPSISLHHFLPVVLSLPTKYIFCGYTHTALTIFVEESFLNEQRIKGNFLSLLVICGRMSQSPSSCSYLRTYLKHIMLICTYTVYAAFVFGTFVIFRKKSVASLDTYFVSCFLKKRRLRDFLRKGTYFLPDLMGFHFSVLDQKINLHHQFNLQLSSSTSLTDWLHMNLMRLCSMTYF